MGPQASRVTLAVMYLGWYLPLIKQSSAADNRGGEYGLRGRTAHLIGCRQEAYLSHALSPP
jgi:hypothetical protein